MPIKLIASDLDGTLVDKNNFIPIENLNAIENIHKKIFPLLFVLGKTYSITKDICDKCHASYGIFGNGTQIINLKTGEELYKNLVSLDEFNSCYELAKKHSFHVHIYTDHEVITQDLQYMDLRNYILNGHNNSDNLSFHITQNLKQYVNENCSSNLLYHRKFEEAYYN